VERSSIDRLSAVDAGRRPALRAAVKEGGVLRFRGPRGPRLPAQAGVPSRYCREEAVEWSSFDRLSAVDAGRRPALRAAVKEGRLVRFRGPRGPRLPAQAGVPSRFGREEAVEWSSFDRLSAVDAGRRPALRGAVKEGGVVRFRGPRGPRLPAQAGVPSRYCREEGVERSSIDRLSAVDAGRRPALRSGERGWPGAVPRPSRAAAAGSSRRSKPLLPWRGSGVVQFRPPLGGRCRPEAGAPSRG